MADDIGWMMVDGEDGVAKGRQGGREDSGLRSAATG